MPSSSPPSATATSPTTTGGFLGFGTKTRSSVNIDTTGADSAGTNINDLSIFDVSALRPPASSSTLTPAFQDPLSGIYIFLV
jgi:hypothetical protein